MHLKKTDKPRDGSALLFALGIALVLSLTLGGYFYLTISDRTLAARSLAWNSAIPVAEAGIEEAMTQLYYTGTNNLTTNNWTLGGDGWYHHPNRTLSSGSFYGTAIQLTAYPTIWSTGCVAAPFGTNAFIRRLVKVTAVKSPNVGVGVFARGSIAFSGGAFLDSYSSCDGSYGTNNVGTNAVSSSNAGTAGAINLSGGYIAGVAATGPGGTVTLSGSAYINGTTRHDANQQIDDVTAPVFSTYSTSIPSGMVNGTNYLHVAGTGNYMVSTLADISSNTKGMVVNGNAVIYVTSTGNNAVVVSGSGFIYITPGSSLTLYSAGNITISGGGVVNGSQVPSDCYIYGLPTCTAVTYSGSAAFIGVLDAPEALLTLSGGSGSFGSFTANTVKISGSSGVHADSCLGGPQGYIVRSWNELPAQ